MSQCICTVESLQEFLVCTESSCNQPSIRCRNCFKFTHRYQQGQSKKSHPHQLFINSPLYKNFICLIRVLQIIQKKVRKDFEGLSVNIEHLSDMIFSSSQIMQKDVFDHNEGYGYNQFYTFKQLYYGRKSQLGMSPTQQLINSLSRFSFKKFEQVRRNLVKISAEEQLLEYGFNMITNNNTNQLTKFIEEQQTAFYEYCEKLKEQGKQGLDIFAYMQQRRKSPNKMESYYSRNFQNFLQQKYSKFPEKEQLFTLSEFTKYIWTEFHIISTLPREQYYLNHWVQAYQLYSDYYKQSKLQESILSFKIWRQYAAKFPDTSQLKNIYFLDSFIISFIETIIENKLYGSQYEENTNITWRKYSVYLKEFVNVVRQQKLQYVQMSEYKRYYTFRLQSQKILQHIKQAKQIVYNSKVAIQYLNSVFIKGGKASLKNYKISLQKFEADEQAKIQQNEKKQELLRKQLIEELGQDKFYENIFEGFIAQALSQKAELTKENYYFYRNQVLDKFDQNQIRLQNQQLEFERKFIENQEDRKEQMIPEDKQKKIKYSLEVDEELIHQINADEESQDEGYGIEPSQCPCCKGNPQDCQQQQCQMIGYCVTCNF